MSIFFITLVALNQPANAAFTKQECLNNFSDSTAAKTCSDPKAAVVPVLWWKECLITAKCKKAAYPYTPTLTSTTAGLCSVKILQNCDGRLDEDCG